MNDSVIRHLACASPHQHLLLNTMYTINEGQFIHPPEWRDETVNVLTSSTDGTRAFSLVITRDKIPEGMDFSNYALQEVANIEHRLSGFQKLEEQTDYQIDNQPAHYLEYRWTSTEGVLHQIIVFTPHQQRALMFTASAPDEITDHQKTQMQDMLQSFRFSASA